MSFRCLLATSPAVLPPFQGRLPVLVQLCSQQSTMRRTPRSRSSCTRSVRSLACMRAPRLPYRCAGGVHRAGAPPGNGLHGRQRAGRELRGPRDALRGLLRLHRPRPRCRCEQGICNAILDPRTRGVRVAIPLPSVLGSAVGRGSVSWPQSGLFQWPDRMKLSC